MTALEAKLQFEKILLWLVVIGGALTCGLLLSANLMFLVLVLGFVGWLFTLPYHARLSVVVATATFNSAFIVPYFIGRPFVWEFAALTGWSGLFTIVALRRYSPDFRERIREHKWMLLGALGYVMVLGLLMYARGTGLNLFKSQVVGGRIYFQQITCAVFPILFLAVYLDKATLIRLFFIQCSLSITFLLSDVILAYGTGSVIWGALFFLGLSNDALSFESAFVAQGFRRWQSLATISFATFQILLACVGLREFFLGRRWWAIPLAGLLLTMGLFGGHRGLLVMTFLTIIGVGYAQRYFTPFRILILTKLLAVGVVAVYMLAPILPIAAQRPLTVFPGIQVSPVARADAMATWEGRGVMRRVGWQVAPQFRWLGRGFGQNNVPIASPELDPYGTIQAHLEIGRFYNGLMGLLVNTGLPGTFAMSLFLLAGSVVAVRLLRQARDNECARLFDRVATVVASTWLAQVIIYFTLHGDSEFAMRTFALHAGMLVAFKRHYTQEALEAAKTNPVQVSGPGSGRRPTLRFGGTPAPQMARQLPAQ